MLQLELSPEIESALDQESKGRGMSAAQLSAEILTQHTSQWKASKPQPDDHRDKRELIQQYIALMKRRNPDYETTDPYALDWQAIKAEGRRY